MTIAIVLPPTADSFRPVAGLAVIQRTLLAAWRAGVERVVVLDGPSTPQLRPLLNSDARTRTVEVATDLSSLVGSKILLLPSDCVLTAKTLLGVLDAPLDGRPLLFESSPQATIGVCSAAQLAAIDTHGVTAAGADALWAACRQHGATRLSLDSETCVVRVTDSRDVEHAERALCNRLRADSAASDGPLAHWLDRRVSLRISRWLVAHTQLRPNHVTLIGTAVGLTAAAFLGVGTYWTGVVGTLLFLCATTIDGCDGEVARLKFQESSFGQKFDVITDNIVHLAIFVGLAVGLYQRAPSEHHLWLMGLLLGGFACDAALSYFFLVRRPNFAASGGPPTTWQGRMRQGLLRGFEALMNRDFAYLLVVLAIIDRLDWFLWGTAFGTYLFAIALILVYGWSDRSDILTVSGSGAGHSTMPDGDAAESSALTGSTPRPGGALRIAERIFLVAGIILLIVLVRELGAGTVLSNLTLVGWGIIPIVLQESLAYVANTLGWWSAFPRPRPRIRFRQLVSARIAGDAVNYTTPTATLGGEFVRMRLLRGLAPTTQIVASVAVAKLSQTVGQIAFVVVGLAIVIDETPLPPGLRRGLVSGLALFSLLVIGLVLAQRRGMFAPLLRLAQRIGLPTQPPHWARTLQHLDDEIARFHGAANGAFLVSSLCFMAGWACGVLEMYLILWFLDVPVTFHRALTVEVLSVAIDGMLFFVPAKAGTQEGGKVLIFTLLGLDPAKGLAVGILRRIRELVWSLVGLTILSRHHLSTRAVLRDPVGS